MRTISETVSESKLTLEETVQTAAREQTPLRGLYDAESSSVCNSIAADSENEPRQWQLS